MTSSPTTMVILGASGDLTERMLLPALVGLWERGELEDGFRVIGYARSDLGADEFRRMAPTDDPEFLKRMDWVRGEYDDLQPLAEALDGDSNDLLLYCAVPPGVYADVVHAAGKAELNKDARIVIEKPFGTDLGSAESLNEAIHSVFDESQVFRIDHYLGKETVQNILVFRFSNGLFEPTWNRLHVSSVEITVAEVGGVGHRVGFYDDAGATRDIVQNHVMQVLTFLAMEPPATFDSESIRDEKAKVLRSLRPVDPDEVVFGQYEGYAESDGVADDSRTETYVAMRMWIDNWRWKGVPFVIRTGKRLAERVTEVTLRFNDAPQTIFHGGRPGGNHLSLRIQPQEGIYLTFDAKVPGAGMDVQPVTMGFDYEREFGAPPPNAYERLLADAMAGDKTLFPRADEAELAWKIIDPILTRRPKPKVYPQGSWGPTDADRLVGSAGWHSPPTERKP